MHNWSLFSLTQLAAGCGNDLTQQMRKWEGLGEKNGIVCLSVDITISVDIVRNCWLSVVLILSKEVSKSKSFLPASLITGCF